MTRINIDRIYFPTTTILQIQIKVSIQINRCCVIKTIYIFFFLLRCPLHLLLHSFDYFQLSNKKEEKFLLMQLQVIRF